MDEQPAGLPHDPRFDLNAAPIIFPPDMPEEMQESMRALYWFAFNNGAIYEIERDHRWSEQYWNKWTISRLFSALNLICVGLCVGYGIGINVPGSWQYLRFVIWAIIALNLFFGIRQAVLSRRIRKRGTL